MRSLYFLVPGLGGRFACGGLWAELKTLKLAQAICPAHVITYRQREEDTLFLPDLLKTGLPDGIFVVSWGFDVPKLLRPLQGQPVIYHAHSSGYGFKLPPQIPIVTVSRNTLGHWGQAAPTSLLYYLPNEISPEFQNTHQTRDIDVLVQGRKSSHYLLNQLVPALAQVCRVERVDQFVADLPGLFNRTKVYLYDSAEYWATQGVTEGFGLQPLEAMACGCQVFSSVNHGLSDYLDPGFHGHKIAGYCMDFDVQRILKHVHQFQPVTLGDKTLGEYRAEAIYPKFRHILEELNDYFDACQGIKTSDIPSLTPWRIQQLRWQHLGSKLSKMSTKFRQVRKA